MNRLSYLKNNIITYLAVAIFGAMNIAIFAPLELYLSNKDFFFFEGNDLLGVMGAMAIAIIMFVMIVMCIAAFLSKRAAKILLGFGFGFIMALYIQGNFLPGDYGSLDGTAIDWSQYAFRGVLSVFCFGAIILISVLAAIRVKKDGFEKGIRLISICVVLVQCITLVTLLLQNNFLGKEKKYLASTENEFVYSEDENFVILMLDSFDATSLKKVLDEDSDDTYKDMLTDFNFYPDTSGMYKSTVFALPYLMNGVEYLNDCTYEEFLVKGYEESTLINKLEANDWYTGIYNLNRMPASDIALKAENCKEVKLTVSSHRRLGEYMYKLVLFRYMPQPLKKFFWFYADDINTELMDNQDDIELYSDVNMEFYENIGQIHAGSDRKTFHFYELLGAHPPYYLNSSFEITGVETDTYETSRGLVYMINKYTDKLKEAGVYDNTTIIVLADHGIDLRHNPVFMIKYAGASHEFYMKDEPFSYSYLQELYGAVIDGKNEKECNQIIDNHIGEVREYLLYDENDGMNSNDYFTADIIRCYIDGKAYSENAVNFGTEVYKCVE